MTRKWWDKHKLQVGGTGHPNFHRIFVKYMNELEYDPPAIGYLFRRWLADGANFKVVRLYNEEDNRHGQRDSTGRFSRTGI